MNKSSLVRYLLLTLNSQDSRHFPSPVEFKSFSDWQKAEQLFRMGYYNLAAKLRSLAIHKQYRKVGITFIGYFPKYFSGEFWDAFGHRALLATHIAAQRLGILPKGKRTLLIDRDDLESPFLQCLSEEIEVTVRSYRHTFGTLPRYWPYYEQLQCIKGHVDFLDTYELIESVFSRANVSKDNPLFRLPSQYREKASTSFEALGIPKNAWFVTVHVRDDGGGYSLRRNQDIETFRTAMAEVVEHGGWIVRIGDHGMKKMGKSDSYVDLAALGQNYKWLHLYALAECKFFLGTQSGPAMYPPLFGVPSINTNSTSIGRNVFRNSQHSIYLPKLIRSKEGKLLTLRQTLESEEGFGELQVNRLRETGLTFVSNTSEEILQATKEMMATLQNPQEQDNPLHNRVEEIRQAFKGATHGTFSLSFLKSNLWWLN